MLGYHTPSQTPPAADTPREQTHSRHPLRSRHTPREQTQPLEQTPPRADPPQGADTSSPSAEHTGRYGQCAGGTHPTGMQSCCWLENYQRTYWPAKIETFDVSGVMLVISVLPFFKKNWGHQSFLCFKNQGGFHYLHACLPACNGFLRFTSGATPADHLATSLLPFMFRQREIICLFINLHKCGFDCCLRIQD